MNKHILGSGVLLAMLAVVLGALGAHYLKTILSPELQSSFETGVRYQFYHGIALIVLGLYSHLFQRETKWIFYLLMLGVLCFSFSIYTLCLMKSNGFIGIKGLGLLTPVGGILMIGGWIIWLRDILRQSWR